MPLGIGRNKRGSPERGEGAEPLQYSDLHLKDKQRKEVESLIATEAGTHRSIDLLEGDWEKTGNLRWARGENRSIVLGHMKAEIISRREAAAVAGTNWAGQPSQG